MQSFNSSMLSDAGLNLQSVFNISDLPASIIKTLGNHCGDLSAYSQLLLVGHGGRRLWENVSQAGMDSDHPIDAFTIETISRFFSEELPDNILEFIFPGSTHIGLQGLGVLAGWHHDSPFRVGINADWGSWYAYRAVVLSDTGFTPSQVLKTSSPCDDCCDKPCISKCPGLALENGGFSLEKCLDYRKLENSNCESQCLSRLSCPVSSEHRYTIAQINYHYGRSMAVIRNWKSA